MVGLSNNKIQKYDVGQIPSIPHVLLKLIEACHAVDVSFEELSDIIQKDAGLCAKVIAVANSPAYAQWNDVKDFNRLLVVLGLNTIKTIAITTAVHQFFSQFNTEMGRWVGGFWRHSLSCAYAAKLLARLTGYEPADEAYLAGLLHQVGQLVLLKKEPDQYPELLLNAQNDRELTGLERELFGISGNEVGAQLVHDWDPDSMLGDAVLYQREPAEAVIDTPRLVRLINFAHKLSARSEPSEELMHEAGVLFGLSQPVIDDLKAEMQNGVAKAAEGLGIKLDPDAQSGQDFCADGEEVRLALAHKVREFALLDGVERHLSGSPELDDALLASLQDLRILFGLSRGVCFLTDPAMGLLQPQANNCARPDQVVEFQLQLKPGRSLVADAYLSRKLKSSLDPYTAEHLAVVDRQLIKLLDAEGMLCIPLFTEQEGVGVLAASLDAADLQRMQKQTDLLLYFAEVVARTVYHRQRLTRGREEALAQERELKQGQIRKLVHEANNPLAIIKNYLQVLSIRLGNESGVQDQLAILSEEIERVADIILRMRDISPPAEILQGAVDVNELLHDLVGIFRVSHFTTREIKADIRLDRSMPPIMTNRNSLKQVVTNLIKNAVEAMSSGGVLTVASRDRVNIDGTQYIELLLADTGPGIPVEMLDNVFRPVKSGKGGAHSGLGLTIVKNLISDINGSISCRNRREGGAEFTLHLPRILEKK
ncbi:MAG: HDOD domain-containing protein [Gammaproteobacteria bacterium]|nr:HDOD domain-containing protein [Gammaproteobacteria bacterium]